MWQPGDLQLQQKESARGPEKLLSQARTAVISAIAEILLNLLGKAQVEGRPRVGQNITELFLKLQGSTVTNLSGSWRSCGRSSKWSIALTALRPISQLWASSAVKRPLPPLIPWLRPLPFLLAGLWWSSLQVSPRRERQIWKSLPQTLLFASPSVKLPHRLRDDSNWLSLSQLAS